MTHTKIAGMLKRAGFEMGRVSGRIRDYRPGVTVRKLSPRVSAVFANDAETTHRAAVLLHAAGLEIWSPMTRAVVTGPVQISDVSGGCFKVGRRVAAGRSPARPCTIVENSL